MNSDAFRIVESPAFEPGELTEIVRQIQEYGGAQSLSRPIMLKALAELRKELRAVQKAQLSLERLAQSRERRRRSAKRPALFLVRQDVQRTRPQ